MRLKIHLIGLFVLTSLSVHAQEPDFAWVKRIGDNSAATGNMHGPVVTVDGAGNSYIAGVWLGQSYILDGITLTPPIPTTNTPNGYIAKYDPNGQIVWAKSMTNVMAISGLQGGHYPNKMIVDAQGNIYFSALGATDGHCLINGRYLTDSTATYVSLPNRYAMFLTKLDADGNVRWIKKTSHPQYFLTENIGKLTNEIFFDAEGDINMTGAFHSYVSFNPGDTLKTATDQVSVFLTRYTPTGDILLSKKLDGTTYPKAQFGTEQVRTDASGNLYRWSSRFLNNPKRLYRYSPEGMLSDSLTLNVSVTGLECKLNSFTVNATGDVFIGGYFMGNLILEGTTHAGYGNPNTTDAVLFKLAAPNYGVDWVKTHLTAKSDSYDQLLTDGLGNIYATGQYANAQEAASMVHKYSPDGNQIWAKSLTGLSTPQIPNTGNVTATALCQAQNGGNIRVGGRFAVNAYFSANNHFSTPSLNHYNGFLAQYGLCNTTNPAIDSPLRTILCGQESITLSATLGTPGLTYRWSTPTGIIPAGGAGTIAELTVTRPGKYFLLAQENAECYGKSQEIWITQTPLPNTAVTTQNNTLTATETATGTQYQWLDCGNGNTPVNGADAVSFTPTQNGSYSVKITSEAGCTDTSACYTINSLGMDDPYALNKLLSVYPNPARDAINIQGAADILSVRVLDLQGKELMRSSGQHVSVSGLPGGMYLLEIKTATGIGVKSFVKE